MVCDDVPSPSIQRFPIQKAEDIGPMFEVPSGFKVVMRTTGVPQYRTAGLMVECVIVGGLDVVDGIVVSGGCYRVSVVGLWHTLTMYRSTYRVHKPQELDEVVDSLLTGSTLRVDPVMGAVHN